MRDIGYSIIPQMKATFWLFFSPSQSIIFHCLQRRNSLADGGFTLRVVTQSVPVGCESGAKAAVGAAESRKWCRSCLPSLLRGSMGSAARLGTQRLKQLLEIPFPEIPGALRHRSVKMCT